MLTSLKTFTNHTKHLPSVCILSICLLKNSATNQLEHIVEELFLQQGEVHQIKDLSMKVISQYTYLSDHTELQLTTDVWSVRISTSELKEQILTPRTKTCRSEQKLFTGVKHAKFFFASGPALITVLKVITQKWISGDELILLSIYKKKMYYM